MARKRNRIFAGLGALFILAGLLAGPWFEGGGKEGAAPEAVRAASRVQAMRKIRKTWQLGADSRKKRRKGSTIRMRQRFRYFLLRA